MKSLAFLALAALSATTAAFGFRPFNDGSDSLVQALESNFQVSHQIELYDVSVFPLQGEPIQTRAFLIYQYGEDSARGVWRILPSETSGAVTLLVLQGPDLNPPTVFLHDAASGRVGWLEGREKHAPFGPTGWNLEDAYDDDKEDWNNTRGPNRPIANTFSTQIIQSYRDPVLRRESLYGSRKVFLSPQDSRLLRLDYLDRENNLIKRLTADNHSDFGAAGAPRIRARRLTIRHFETGSLTVMNLARANYDCTLPGELFTPRFVAAWAEEDDRRILRQTKPLADLLQP